MLVRVSVTRPPPAFRRGGGPAASSTGGVSGSTGVSGVLISSRAAFQVVLPSTPAGLSLHGGQATRSAHPVAAAAAHATSEGEAPRSGSTSVHVTRARQLHRASILQTAATMQLREANDARFEENKYVARP